MVASQYRYIDICSQNYTDLSGRDVLVYVYISPKGQKEKWWSHRSHPVAGLRGQTFCSKPNQVNEYIFNLFPE